MADTPIANDVRTRARAYLNQVPLAQDIRSNSAGKVIGSSLTEAQLFTKLTTRTQEGLEKQWYVDNKRTTTCNEFVGQLSLHLFKVYLGVFELEAFLKKIGKGHAYVAAASGARPGYGDVFRAKTFHMGVSLDFAGDNWNTVESGQGGPTTGHDIIRRKSGGWNSAAVEGWADIELFTAPRPGSIVEANTGPVPPPLLGWWRVWWHGQAYYFWLDADRRANWTRKKPAMGRTAPPAQAEGAGTFIDDVHGGLIIRWPATNWEDRLDRVKDNPPIWKGLRNDTTALQVEHL